MVPNGQNGTSTLDLQGLSATSEVAEGHARYFQGLRVLEGPGHGDLSHHTEPLGWFIHSLGEIPVSMCVAEPPQLLPPCPVNSWKEKLPWAARVGCMQCWVAGLARSGQEGCPGGCGFCGHLLAPARTETETWPLLGRGWRKPWVSHHFFSSKPHPDPEGQAADRKQFSGAAEHRAADAAAAVSRLQGGRWGPSRERAGGLGGGRTGPEIRT